MKSPLDQTDVKAILFGIMVGAITGLFSYLLSVVIGHLYNIKANEVSFLGFLLYFIILGAMLSPIIYRLARKYKD